MTNVKRIESYGLYDFCQDIEQAFKEGYSFDFSTNENFPTAYGTMLTCGLVKISEEVVTEVETESQDVQVAETVSSSEQTEQVDESVTSTDQTEEVEQVVTEVEATVTEVEEVSEAEPAKRGPKPKAK